MTAPVGADIESLCSKCGDVWHVVVAKVGEKIAKVQCKQCHGFHRYKPLPGKEGTVGKAPKAVAGATAKAKTTGATRAKTKSKKSSEPDRPSVAPDLSRPVRRYIPAEAYASGDRIQHPTFGLGVVESFSPGKVQVAFPDGRRVLAAAKAASTLDRPTNRPHDKEPSS